MEEKPLVSVIISTYNRKNLLPVAIKSVLNQTMSNFEIIVVNDNGVDVQDIINSFKDSRIKYINKKVNQGLGAARNSGLDIAKGRYVNFLDDDDGFYSFHLETLVTYLMKTKEKIAYSDCVCHVQKVNDKGEYITINRIIGYSFDYDPEMILYQNIVPVLGVMYEFQDEKLNKIRLDEKVLAYEDWLLWLSLTEFYPMHHIPEPTCYYVFKQDGSTMSSSRNDFTTLLPEIYANNINRAKDKVKIANIMNQILQQRGLQPLFNIQYKEEQDEKK